MILSKVLHLNCRDKRLCRLPTEAFFGALTILHVLGLIALLAWSAAVYSTTTVVLAQHDLSTYTKISAKFKLVCKACPMLVYPQF